MLPYIKAVAPGLTAINHVILSHPHRDHVQLMADLVTAFQVNEVWDWGALNPICAYRAFLAAVRDEKGAQFNLACGVGVYLFYPPYIQAWQENEGIAAERVN